MACANTAICIHKLNRFHLSCLTCPQRRSYYKKDTVYTRRKHIMYLGESVNPLGSVVPAGEFISYFLIIPTEKQRTDVGKQRWSWQYYTWKYILKIHFIKFLLTIAETLSQW